MVKFGLQLHFVHISGKLMIDVGVDGLSRGQLSGGVMAGDTIFLHVPLHLAAPERSPGVTDWIQSWWPDENEKLQFLTPHGWFCEGHGI